VVLDVGGDVVEGDELEPVVVDGLMTHRHVPIGLPDQLVEPVPRFAGGPTGGVDRRSGIGGGEGDDRAPARGVAGLGRDGGGDQPVFIQRVALYRYCQAHA